LSKTLGILLLFLVVLFRQVSDEIVLKCIRRVFVPATSAINPMKGFPKFDLHKSITPRDEERLMTLHDSINLLDPLSDRYPIILIQSIVFAWLRMRA
jgi:hypothetical protein